MQKELNNLPIRIKLSGIWLISKIIKLETMRGLTI
jgi:hypothetical protein